MLSAGSWTKIEQLNPAKIFVENVRSLLNISRLEARTLCEMAVSDQLFEKRVGLVCPDDNCNGRILADFKWGEQMPESISCKICQVEDREQSTYRTSDLKKVEFYKLK
jgi:hypothetical protein